jgi:plasmid stability protein
MPALIQIRNVPDDVHRKLTERAASSGKSLNSLMLEIVEREVERPTMAQVAARIRATPMPPVGSGQAAEVIREAREERDRELLSRIGRAR